MSVLVRKFANGVYIPVVSLGTWQLDSADAPKAVGKALEHGYRAVDDAWVYQNEPAVGQAVQAFNGKVTGPEKKPVPTGKSVVISEKEFLESFAVPHGKPKDDRKVFVTSKIWVKHFTPQEIRSRTMEHLKNFGKSSCDLMLLHWPGGHPGFSSEEDQKQFNKESVRFECWRTLEELYHEGLIRAIGVSNYMVKHLKPLLEDIEKRKAAGDKNAMVPVVNQIEINPYHHPPTDLQKLCEDNKIAFTSYSTMGGSKGFAEVNSDKTFHELGAKYGKPTPNVVLRWAMQKEFLVLPKSSKEDRVVSNYDVMDWSIPEEDMKKIDALNQDRTFLLDPDLIN